MDGQRFWVGLLAWITIILCLLGIWLALADYTKSAIDKLGDSTAEVDVDRSTTDRVRIDNPNAFNENFIYMDETVNALLNVNRMEMSTAALYLYENTGCQLYIIGIDITGQDITNYNEAYDFAASYVRDLINDPYAVSILISNEVFTVDGTISLLNEVFYGKETNSYFDANGRTIFQQYLTSGNTDYVALIKSACDKLNSYVDYGPVIITALRWLGGFGIGIVIAWIIVCIARFIVRRNEEKKEYLDKILNASFQPITDETIAKYMQTEDEQDESGSDRTQTG